MMQRLAKTNIYGNNNVSQDVFPPLRFQLINVWLHLGELQSEIWGQKVKGPLD